MSNTKIKVEVTIEATIEKVWDYFTLPTHITQWYFASEDWHVPQAENDLQVGGKFFTRMEAKDNSFGFDFEGVYEAVVLHERIEYGLEDGRKVQILFSKMNEQNVNVVELFDPEEVNNHELQKAGWQAILENFKKYVETKNKTF